jgi:hypothetical protein
MNDDDDWYFFADGQGSDGEPMVDIVRGKPYPLEERQIQGPFPTYDAAYKAAVDLVGEEYVNNSPEESVRAKGGGRGTVRPRRQEREGQGGPKPRAVPQTRDHPTARLFLPSPTTAAARPGAGLTAG